MEYRFADCVLGHARRTLTRGGDPVSLEPQVFDLIALLVSNPDRAIPRDELVDVVWGGRIVSDSAISARIASARKAVSDDGKRQEVIRTVARVGLQMATPVEDQGAEPPQARAATLAAPSIRYTKNVHGHALAYTVSGKGPPVLRSYLGSHLEGEWNAVRPKAVFDLLQEKNALLRVDYVGAGMSSRDAHLRDFNDAAEDLRIAVDAAGLDRLSLFSESGGVHAALRFAVRYPDRVEKMIIVGGYVHGRSHRAWSPQGDFLKNMIGESWSDGKSSVVRALCLAYYPDGPMDEVYETAEVIFNAFDVEPHQAARDAINSVSNVDLLGQIRIPTLIVHGRHDAIHPLSEAQKLATGIANAELVVLDTANHLPFPGHPTWPKFASVVRNFLDK
ncbi:MAG: alpha/beta fold hydrolase [Pseudomonadota bacterium]